MKDFCSKVALIIPAYEPDEKLIELSKQLNLCGIERLLIVDDGSGEAYQHIFDAVKENVQCEIFVHAVNLGKGRALKDAFNYVLNKWPDVCGVVTADSDGQHTPEDIMKIMETLYENPDKLVLGVRQFDGSDVPARSKLGNQTTSKVFKLLLGIAVSDTQTGLRGIGVSFMKHLMRVSGEKYEFETNMLLETKNNKIDIIEVPISTVYIENNATSHFRPLQDSVRIYMLFFKYILSSGLSCVVDLVLFSLLCKLLRNGALGVNYLLVATAAARVVSAVVNYFINLKVVFASGVSVKKSAWKYACLAVIQLCASAFLVRTIYPFFGGAELLVKIPVDLVLFVVNYAVQREFVYRD